MANLVKTRDAKSWVLGCGDTAMTARLPEGSYLHFPQGLVVCIDRAFLFKIVMWEGRDNPGGSGEKDHDEKIRFLAKNREYDGSAGVYFAAGSVWKAR
jgi:hypothetical protein